MTAVPVRGSWGLPGRGACRGVGRAGAWGVGRGAWGVGRGAWGVGRTGAPGVPRTRRPGPQPLCVGPFGTVLPAAGAPFDDLPFDDLPPPGVPLDDLAAGGWRRYGERDGPPSPLSK